MHRPLEEAGRGGNVGEARPETNTVRYQGRRERAEHLGKRLSAEPALDPGVCLELSEACAVGMRRWLLVRRGAKDPSDERHFLAHGPEETNGEELVRVCTARWQIEECFAQAKGEVGLDQYEMRKWVPWHRHVTLCLLAHAYLVAMRRAARLEEREKKGAPTPA